MGFIDYINRSVSKQEWNYLKFFQLITAALVLNLLLFFLWILTVLVVNLYTTRVQQACQQVRG